MVVMLARGLVVALGLWLVLLVAAPIVLAQARPGVPMYSAVAAYVGGSFVCHQLPERSFHVAGRPMPVCARCTGLYVSAFVGGVLALGATRRRLGERIRLVLAAGAAVTLVSWATDYTGLSHTSNTTRALLALPLGLAAGWAVITLLREPRGSSLEVRGSRLPTAAAAARSRSRS